MKQATNLIVLNYFQTYRLVDRMVFRMYIIQNTKFIESSVLSFDLLHENNRFLEGSQAAILTFMAF